MAGVLSLEQTEEYDRDSYLCPFTACPAEVVLSNSQKLLDFEQEIGQPVEINQ